MKNEGVNILIKGKTNLIFIVTIIFFMIFSVVKSVESTSQVFTEGFENGLPDDWIYVHPNLWSTTTEMVRDGFYSLKLNGTGGMEFEGVQIPINISNGTIEAWVFPQSSNTLEPMLYLRTSQNDGTDILTIKSGYGIRIYDTYAVLFRITDYSLHLLDNISLGEYIGNKWWYMKLEVEDSLLNAWVNTSSTLNSTPLLSYDISDDLEQYHSGYPAISGRATLGASYTTHFDSIRIVWELNSFPTSSITSVDSSCISTSTSTTGTLAPGLNLITEGYSFLTTLIFGLVLIYNRKLRE